METLNLFYKELCEMIYDEFYPQGGSEPFCGWGNNSGDLWQRFDWYLAENVQAIHKEVGSPFPNDVNKFDSNVLIKAFNIIDGRC